MVSIGGQGIDKIEARRAFKLLFTLANNFKVKHNTTLIIVPTRK